MPPSPSDLSATRMLLGRCQDGDPAAGEELFELVRGELRRLAVAAMGRQAKGHTLQPTALVHEAWMRLLGSKVNEFRGRDHFLASAARAMRSVLVDHARRKRADKRLGRERQPLDDKLLWFEERAFDLVELDDALDRLARRSPVRAQAIELRFFAGLTTEEAARVLEVSTATLERQWRLARMYLREQLRPSSS